MNHLIFIFAAALALGFLPPAHADWAGLPASATGIKAADAPLPMPPALQAVVNPNLICVDPGHPNTFNAATDMVNGTNENHINWQVSQRLERILKEKGFEVVMTKSAEMQYVENKDRALICNRAGAALAVHLHCESTPGSGFAIYYPDRIGTHDYKDDPDNGFKGPSKEVMQTSQDFGGMMSGAMRTQLAGVMPSRGLFGDSRTQVGSTQGALTFSIFSQIPTITIEMVVLTNKNDAAFIKSDAGQEKMAQAIAAGIQQYQPR